MVIEPMPQKRIHRNVPQLVLNMVMATIMIAIWGRATGKTQGASAPWLLYNVLTMPRSTGAIICFNYAHMISKVLPELVMGWEEMGYIEGIHFWRRELPPKHFNVPKAYRPVDDPQYCIFWYNGTQIKLFSLNHNAPGNGDSVDFILAEEARLLKREDLDQMLLTRRGGRQHFGHLSNHGSLLMVSDMPRKPEERWLLEYEKQQMDEDTFKTIIGIQYQISQLQVNLMGGVTEAKAVTLEREIEKYQAQLNELRKDTVFVSYADTFQNIHALGIDVLKGFRRTLNDLEYDMSVLNKRLIKVADCFYPTLTEERHGYRATNYKWIDANPSVRERDCRWDTDVDLGRTLDAFFDHNKAINCLAVGQLHEKEFRMVNALRVQEPRMMLDLVDLFCWYYRFHRTKVVNYYYDHTSKKGDARNPVPFSADVMERFRKHGWLVNDNYVGQATSHEARFEEWGRILREEEGQPFVFRFNLDNCGWWMYACHQAGTKQKVTQGKKKFEKNKDSERPGSGVLPHEATHITEAGDGLVISKASEMKGAGIGFGSTTFA